MREIVFRVLSDRPGQIEATAENRPITITAGSLEELHHEAREAHSASGPRPQHLPSAHLSARHGDPWAHPRQPSPADGLLLNSPGRSDDDGRSF